MTLSTQPVLLQHSIAHVGSLRSFFRNLKQNLHIKSFLGTSQNAVEIQIRTALIMILLLQYLKRIAKHPWCLSNLTASLRLNTFTKIDLFLWINEPFPPPPDEPEIA